MVSERNGGTLVQGVAGLRSSPCMFQALDDPDKDKLLHILQN